MKKTVITGLLLLVLNTLKALQPYRRFSLQVAKLKISLCYLHIIKVLRLCLVSLLGLTVFLILFIAGVVLFHVGILFYAPWNPEIKLGLTLFCAILYMGVSVKAFSYILSEKRWVKIFDADQIIKDFVPSSENSSSKTQANKTYHR